jgi:transcription antitermination factor NusG
VRDPAAPREKICRAFGGAAGRALPAAHRQRAPLRATREEIHQAAVPGYVFARAEAERKGCVIHHDDLIRAIDVEDEARLLRQMEDVRRIVASGLELSLHPLVQGGTRVRVVAGPLRGLEGIVADSAAASGIVIAIDFLRQGVLVKLPLADLRPLP